MRILPLDATQAQAFDAAENEFEVREVENLFRRENINFINSTHFSVEEISAKILVEKGVERRLK